jgi:hypothetical protein
MGFVVSSDVLLVGVILDNFGLADCVSGTDTLTRGESVLRWQHTQGDSGTAASNPPPFSPDRLDDYEASAIVSIDSGVRMGNEYRSLGMARYACLPFGIAGSGVNVLRTADD